MVKKPTKKSKKSKKIVPLLKSVELMSKISGIGENLLRQLMNEGKLEYLQIGNRRLLKEEAILAYYERNKVSAQS